MDKFNILGCFVSTETTSTEELNEGIASGKLFRSYIWGEKGIDNKLVLLKHEKYGEDLTLGLLQFYVNPGPSTIPYLKEIESYRKKEKAIGIPIIITDENFFNKTEEERYEFLRISIMQKMDLLEAIVKRRKLDTNMKQLKLDLEKILVFP